MSDCDAILAYSAAAPKEMNLKKMLLIE